MFIFLKAIFLELGGIYETKDPTPGPDFSTSLFLSKYDIYFFLLRCRNDLFLLSLLLSVVLRDVQELQSDSRITSIT